MINLYNKIQYNKIIFILFQIINFTIINSYDIIDSNIVQHCDIADKLLENAISNAKKLYQDNGGECLNYNKITANDLINIPVTNVGNFNKEQAIKKVQIAPDFRVKLEFNQTKNFSILKDTKIILVPEYQKGDMYLFKFQCYTNFDIFYPSNDSTYSNRIAHNTKSILNSILENQDRYKILQNCIYLDQKSSSWQQINW